MRRRTATTTGAHPLCHLTTQAWLGRGLAGWWELSTPPPQVMIHALFVPGDSYPPLKKEYVLKAVNAFQFDVAEVGWRAGWRVE